MDIAIRGRNTTFAVTAGAFAATMAVLVIYYSVQPPGGIAP